KNEEEQVAFFTKHLSVSEIIYSALPIEYPKTSPEGVATIFNVSDWSNPIACFNDVSILYYILLQVKIIVINFIYLIYSDSIIYFIYNLFNYFTNKLFLYYKILDFFLLLSHHLANINLTINFAMVK